MANEKIGQMPSGLPVLTNDAVPIARSGSNFSIPAGAIASLASGIAVVPVGNTAGVTSTISGGLLQLQGGNNITLSQNGSVIGISAGASGAGFSGGVSGGNNQGTTGITGSQLGLVGGNNITLSQLVSTNGASITISAANQTVQTQNMVDVTLGGNTAGVGALISSGTLFLAGGNNVTLSQNGQSVTISANTVAAANLSVSAGSTTGAFGGITFSNGSGLSWGLNNGTITGSVSQTVQTQASGNIGATGFATTTIAGSVIAGTNNTTGFTLAVPPYITTQTVQTQNVVDVTLGGNTAGGLALISSGTLFLAGGNNVTLSQNGQSVTISAGTAAAALLSISAGASTGAFGGITFSNANNNSWGLNNGTVTILAPLNVSGGATSNNVTALAYANGSGVSWGLSTGASAATVTASVAAQTVQTQNLHDVTLGGTNTLGALALVSSGTLTLAGGNNITLSQAGNAITILGGAGQFSAGVSNIGSSAGNTGITGSQLVLAGGNNITLSQATGPNGATVTVSGGAQSAQTLGVFVSSQTYGQTNSSAIDARSFTHVGQGIITVGLSNSSLMFSASQSAQTMGIYASSQSTGQLSSSTVDARSLTVVGAGVISVGMSQGSLLISAPGSTGISQSLYAIGNTGGPGNTGTSPIGVMSVSAVGNITVGVSNNAILISAGTVAGAPVNISVAGSSANLGSIVFGNNNNVTWGLNGSTVTASVPAVSTLTGAGGITVTANAGQITISAPGTSLLAGVGGISISSNGSTVSVYESPVTRMIWPPMQLSAVGAFANGAISLQYVAPSWPVTASRVDALVSWSGATSATGNTMGIVLSAYAAVFTRNGSTLSLIPGSSGSVATTYSYASNTAGAPFYASAVRAISVPLNMSMTPGEYFVGFNISTNSVSIAGATATTNLAQTLSMMGGADVQSALNYADGTAATATSINLYGGMGVYTATSAGIGTTLALSNIAQTGASLAQANIGLVFRNG